MHYLAWRRHGDPLGGRRTLSTPEEAFAARTERRGDCLIWTGSKDSGGYGQLSIGGRLQRSHRYAWEREHGPIPEGVLIDHRYHCDPACCEVSHLREATYEQNGSNLRGARSTSATGIRGVIKRGNSYGASLMVRGKTIWLGSSLDPGEAEFMAVAGRVRMHEFHSPADLDYLAARGLSPADFQPGGRHHNKDD